MKNSKTGTDLDSSCWLFVCAALLFCFLWANSGGQSFVCVYVCVCVCVCVCVRVCVCVVVGMNMRWEFLCVEIVCRCLDCDRFHSQQQTGYYQHTLVTEQRVIINYKPCKWTSDYIHTRNMNICAHAPRCQRPVAVDATHTCSTCRQVYKKKKNPDVWTVWTVSALSGVCCHITWHNNTTVHSIRLTRRTLFRLHRNRAGFLVNRTLA